MADSATNNVNDAVKSDGFVNFYELLGEEPDATTTRLRARINDLYSEAQANRDHRNITKRREYEMTIELLPRCRTALLEPDKRTKYDAYLAEVKAGKASVDFDTFMDQLSGKSEADAAERAALLATKDAPAEKPAAAPKRKPARKSSSSDAVMGSVVAVILFFAVFIVLALIMHKNPVKAILAAAVIGIVAFIVSKVATKVS